MANDLLKAQIEAALFLSEKPLKAAAVARIVNADVNVVRQMIIELIHDYEARNGGLEVADDDGYIIQVKDEYTHLVDEFVPIDMPTALIRTLSAIAIKQPVIQSEIIKIRGAGAYDHIKDLLERELISKKEDGGRSPVLTTTKKFQEYFRLSKDGKSFRQQMTGEGKAAAAAVAESDERERENQELASPEINTFDASPDPDTPPIGISGLGDDELAQAPELESDKVILEDIDTNQIAETVSQTSQAGTGQIDAEFDVMTEKATVDSTNTASDVNKESEVIATDFSVATEAGTTQ